MLAQALQCLNGGMRPITGHNREGVLPMRHPPSRLMLNRRGVIALGAAAALPVSLMEARAEGTTIRVAYPAAVATLDPAKFRVGGLEYNYAFCVFNRLTTLDAKLQVQPELALSWEPSEDLKIWTFKLRPDVKFHNGKPFTAADVVFTYARLQDKVVASVLRASLDFVIKVEAVDPLTVKFTLAIPYGDLPALTAGYQAMILSESAMDTLTTKPVGTGPFRFVEYSPGNQLVVERNPDYFVPGVPKLERAILRIIPEYTTAVAALESGSIDLVYDLPPELADKVKKSTVAHIEEVTTGTWQGFVMNASMKPFDDPRVREAIIKLVDKAMFTDIATFGHGTPTVTPISPSHPYFRKDLLVKPDVPGAKKLLAEAGFPNGFTTELYIPGSSPSMERLGTAFRDAAKQVGITVELRVIPQDKFFAEMEGKVPFNVDMFFGRPTPDLALYAWYHQTGSWNNTLWHYVNPEVDKLLEAARATNDKAEQQKLYSRFQEIVAKDGPGCIVYVQNFVCGVSNKVKGYVGNPLMFVDISTVTIG
jgi:peptide/nickel transport system substrate-binding protein